ncbi:unnamed protein product [Adineta ricciae]|uniref:Uncharacterized protein n=1 Tax=Adineta ricciae TaxID=249248 RepID=A0A815S788_ADIRI|nr:unnamed protein product [Adineta ricciae]CAF1528568.1 unnamed protein product [Adineta ricciae]
MHGSSEVSIHCTTYDYYTKTCFRRNALISINQNTGLVAKNSGDEFDASTVESGSVIDDEPHRHRVKCQPQVEPSPISIFIAKPGCYYISQEARKRKIPSANI